MADKNKTTQRIDIRNVFLAWLITLIIFILLILSNLAFKISMKQEGATIFSSILISDILLGIFFFVLGIILVILTKIKTSHKSNYKRIMVSNNNLPRYNAAWLFAFVILFLLGGNLINDYVSNHAKVLPIYYPTPSPTIFLQPTYKNVVVPATPTIDPNPLISCNIHANCGGGTIQLRSNECSNTTCCQVGDKWYFYMSRDKCAQDQNTNYQRLPLNNYQNINFDTFPTWAPLPTITPFPTWTPFPTVGSIQQNNNQLNIIQCQNNAKEQYNAQLQSCTQFGASSAGDVCRQVAQNTLNAALTACGN